MAMRLQQKSIVLAVLTIVTGVVAAAMAFHGKATWLEAASFVTGALCVWLTVIENVWNFPIGLLNVATFSVVFFKSRLYADASLQIVYFILGIISWYLWLYGGERHTALRVGLASKVERLSLFAATFGLTIILWLTLSQIGGSASFWDAITASISLAAQWLLNRKRLENWIGWIVVDVIYVPLYMYKELYLTALLYLIFLVMAVMGFVQWRKTWRQQHVGDAVLSVVPQEAAA